MYGNEQKMVSAYVQMRKIGKHFYGRCPFCQAPEGLFLSDGEGRWGCVSCGEHGDAADLISKIRKIPKTEAEDIIRQNAGLPPKGKEPGNDSERNAVFEANRLAEDYFEKKLWSEEGKPGLDYFKDRQLSDLTLKTLHLGYSGKFGNSLYSYLKGQGVPEDVIFSAGLAKKDAEKGRIYDAFWNRVMYPIHDAAGRTAAFGGRVLDDSKPKYINSPESAVFMKRSMLYGLYEPGAYNSRVPFVLCEGYMDVISMYQAGVKNAVATLGTALTEDHAKLIAKYSKNIILCYDSDDPGITAARRAIPILKKEGVSAGIVSFNPCKDPDEFVKKFGVSELYKRFSAREDGFLFAARQKAREYDLQDAKQRASCIRELGQMIYEEDRQKRGHYIRVLSDQFRLPQKALWAVIDILSSEEERGNP